MDTHIGLPENLARPRRVSADPVAVGRAARKAVPRSSLGVHQVAADRPDVVKLLHETDMGRDEELLPLKYERMGASPFAFYRGFAALMTYDLAQTPHSGIYTQLCGDMHLSNFGVYASPERNLLFDVNDFDETLPGPFEWDLKRLVTSFVILARVRGFPQSVGAQAARRAARSYRERISELAGWPHLQMWYDRIDEDTIRSLLAGASTTMRKNLKAGLEKAEARTHARAGQKLTEVVDGQRRFRSDPPLLERVDNPLAIHLVRAVTASYRSTLSNDRHALLDRYEVLDIARKVVGVGSVGTRCWVVLLQGRLPDDLLLLQAKEAGPSVLEPYLRRSAYRHRGRRVVEGQRLMQAASDIFLGWTTGPDVTRHYYLRQLHDMKGGVDTERIRTEGVEAYAQLCGRALARAHARGGDAAVIASYLGTSDRADRALAEFAEKYADQNEADFAEFMQSRQP